MDFEILGRKIEVTKEHFLLISSVMIFFIIFCCIVAAIYTLFFPIDPISDFRHNFDLTLMSQGTIISLFEELLFAFLFLSAADFLKKKKSIDFCRSAAAGFFIFVASILFFNLLFENLTLQVSAIWADIWGLVMIPLFVIGGIASKHTILESLFSLTFHTIILYLWMLILLNPEINKMKKIAIFSIVYSIAVFILLGLLANQTMALYYNTPFSFEITIWTIFNLINYFLFCFVILYHFVELKKMDVSSYIFIIAYLGTPFIRMIDLLITFPIDGGKIPGITFGAIINFVFAIVSLLLIYVLSFFQKQVRN